MGASGPLRELDLTYEFGFHPRHWLTGGNPGRSERTLCNSQRLELLVYGTEGFFIEARSDVSRVGELPVLKVAEQKGSEGFPLPFCEAADHELLLLDQLDLQPLWTAP